MRAAVFSKPGEADEVLHIEQLDEPEPQPGEVRVRLAHAGINPYDTKLLNQLFPLVSHIGSVVPLNDGAGTIDKLGEGVESARLGERVWLYEAMAGTGRGTAAEYVSVKSQFAIPLPDTLGFEAGASLGLPLLTAWYIVHLCGEIKDKKIFVSGGAGLVGNFLIQLASCKGARVIATVSSKEKADAAERAGASLAINYKTSDVVRETMAFTGNSGADICFETNFAGNAPLLPAILSQRGTALVYGSDGPEAAVPFYPSIAKQMTLRFIRNTGMAPAEYAVARDELGDLLRLGKIAGTVGGIFPLEEIASAYQAVIERAHIGKVLLAI